MSVVMDGSRTEQRMGALGRANWTRIKRAELKRDLRAGTADLVDVLLDPPEYAKNMPVLDLLVEMPWVGSHRALKALARVEMSPTRLVSEVSPQRALALVEVLGGARR